MCVDRINDTHLADEQRKPACVLACPTNARLYGDIHDPESIVSKAIRENGGYQLMPEWETKPANHYLPRRGASAIDQQLSRTVEQQRPNELKATDAPSKP